MKISRWITVGVLSALVLGIVPRKLPKKVARIKLAGWGEQRL